jgi:glutaredoxin-like YruB-family protein
MRRFTALLVLVASAGLALGCRDALEKLLQPAPGTERQAESADARGPDSGAGLPGVASIGPAESLRVYFQYVDDRGAVRFVERMEDVPAAWRDRVGFIELDRLPPMAEPPVRDTYADARRAANPGGTGPRVVLYYADWCPWCKKAKDHLRKRGVDFVLRDVDEEEALEELIEKTGQSSIPVIDVNGKILKGFNANDLDQLLSS